MTAGRLARGASRGRGSVGRVPAGGGVAPSGARATAFGPRRLGVHPTCALGGLADAALDSGRYYIMLIGLSSSRCVHEMRRSDVPRGAACAVTRLFTHSTEV